jgi:hypothetical protein
MFVTTHQSQKKTFQELNNQATQAHGFWKAPKFISSLQKLAFPASLSILAGRAFQNQEFKNLGTSGSIKKITYIALKSLVISCATTFAVNIYSLYKYGPRFEVRDSLSSIETTERYLKYATENPIIEICLLHYKSGDLNKAILLYIEAKKSQKSFYDYLQELPSKNNIPTFLKVGNSENIDKKTCDLFQEDFTSILEFRKKLAYNTEILENKLSILKLNHKKTYEDLLNNNILKYSNFLLNN